MSHQIDAVSSKIERQQHEIECLKAKVGHHERMIAAAKVRYEYPVQDDQVRAANQYVVNLKADHRRETTRLRDEHSIALEREVKREFLNGFFAGALFVFAVSAIIGGVAGWL